jgi:hypothetical protein
MEAIQLKLSTVNSTDSVGRKDVVIVNEEEIKVDQSRSRD